MALSLSGTLRDPYGNALPGAVIRFDSVATSTAVLRHVHAEATTDSSGKYSIQVEHGRYNIRVQQGRSLYDLARNVVVNEDSTAETLNQLIADAEYYGELTPPIILQFIELRDEARGYWDESQTAAASANEDAQATAGDRQHIDQQRQAVDIAADQAGQSAQRASDSEQNAAASEQQAAQHETRAEAARDAAQLAGGTFVDTAAGLAATNSGEYFTVPDPGAPDVFLVLYRNDSGSATQVETYPTARHMNDSVQVVYAQRAIINIIEQRLRWKYELSTDDTPGDE